MKARGTIYLSMDLGYSLHCSYCVNAGVGYASGESTLVVAYSDYHPGDY